MIRPLTGIQIGPRQLELPPKSGIGLRRQVRHAVFPTPRGEHIGMLGVVAREGTDAVGAQELLSRRASSPAPKTVSEPGFVQDRSEPPARTPELDRIVDSRPSAPDAPRGTSGAGAHLGILPLKFSLERRDRTQGKQATMDRTFRRSEQPSGRRSTS